MSLFPRAMTSSELTLLRKEGVWHKLSVLIPQSATVYTARVNQATFSDPLVQITYDGGSGTLGDVINGMTVLFGSAAGKSDKGIARIRKTPSATVFYINETSELSGLENNDYITILDEFLPWQRHLTIEETSALMDYDIVYSDQHANCLPVVNMGSDYVLTLGDLTDISITPDASESWVVGASITTYLWVASTASATSGMDTATPTITFDTAGIHRISCTVTADNGKSRTGYRYVYIDQETIPVSVSSIVGAIEEGGWNFQITAYDAVGITEIRDRSKAILVVERSDSEVLGYFTGVENILCIGWIDEETVRVSPEYSEVQMRVSGLHYWLKQETGYPSGMELVTATPTAWTQFQNLTVDKGLWHFLEWRTTVLNFSDFYPTGDTKIVYSLDAQLASLWDQIKTFAYETLLAEITVDRYNRIFCKVPSQFIVPASRSYSTVISLDSGDWLDPLTMDRIISLPVTIVSISGIRDDTADPLFSKAPGAVMSRLGLSYSQDRLLLDNQTHANNLSGLIYARMNNPFRVIDLELSAFNPMIDINTNHYIDITVSSTHNAKEISLTNYKLVINRIEHRFDNSTGILSTVLECEGETGSGQEGTIPFNPGITIEVIPPMLEGLPNIEIPDFEDYSWPGLTPPPTPGNWNWNPPYVPPEPVIPSPEEGATPTCLTDAGQNGPYTGTYGSGVELSADAYSKVKLGMRGVLRSVDHANKTRYEIRGSVYTRATPSDPWVLSNTDTSYTVQAYACDGSIVATGVKDPVTSQFVRSGTFDNIGNTEICGIRIMLPSSEKLHLVTGVSAMIGTGHPWNSWATDTVEWMKYGNGIYSVVTGQFSGSVNVEWLFGTKINLNPNWAGRWVKVKAGYVFEFVSGGGGRTITLNGIKNWPGPLAWNWIAPSPELETDEYNCPGAPIGPEFHPVVTVSTSGGGGGFVINVASYFFITPIPMIKFVINSVSLHNVCLPGSA